MNTLWQYPNILSDLGKIHTNTLTLKRDQRSTRVTKQDKKLNQRSTQKLIKEDKELNREISSDDYSGKCQSICQKIQNSL
ncbi:hypothetical protein AGMMS49936_09050 [Endomicrobiia bacterium]|nr:hypothetical protein AGMMS49936_09050 [Endomicrobiia bacterium]